MSAKLRNRRQAEDTVLFEKIKSKAFAKNNWLEGVEVDLKHNTKDNAFTTIFALGLVLGLPIAPSILNGKREIGLCARLWCYSVAIIRTIMMALTLAYLHQLMPTASMRLTFYLYAFCGYISMAIMFRKRRKLFAAILNLCQLSRTLCPDLYVGEKRIKLYIAIFVLSMVLLHAFLFTFFFEQEFGSFYKAIYTPAFLPDESKDSFINFLLLSAVTSFGISLSTVGFTFLLSCSLYDTLGNYIKCYGSKLKDRARSISWDLEAISDDISVFKNISFRVREVDDAVNVYVLFLYGAIISGFFNTLAILLMQDASYKSLVVTLYVVWVFLFGGGAFLILSSFGSNITDQGDKVKRRMIEYSDRFIRSSPPMHTLEVFSFLFDVIMKSEMVITGGGMFVINYGLILAIAGTMITYGVLILQMDGNNSPMTNGTVSSS
ncbi:hypothetical protein JTE90_024947 [Oedothorax gibbosus]|uniref:Gustatory receptor n=1 Tax=Oedothorax gibbosus TaxID=931172 RepID=A0AAV6TYA0_9ARAC|nr:hypothetical protein JTE90_024947 [Oedothorax gibbosus]